MTSVSDPKPTTPTETELPADASGILIVDLNELAEWDMFCRRTGWKGGAAVHIDTGMNRLGLGLVDVQGLIPRLGSGDHGFTLVMSHLACAEQLHNPMNARQYSSFREA